MFKNSFYYTFEKLSPKFISVLLLPVLLRLIKPELWAEITLLLALQLLFSYFLTQGDERSILKFASNNEQLHKSFMSLIRYSFFGFIFIEVVGSLIKNLPFSIIYGLPFRFMYLSTVVISVNKLFLAKLRSLEKSPIILKSSFVESIFVNGFQLLLIVITVQIDGYDSRVIVTSYFAVQFLGNVIKFFYFVQKIKYNLFESFKYFLSKKPDEFLKFSNISFLILLSNYFLNWQDKFFVEYLFGLKQLGIYSVTTRVSNLGMVFISSILVAAYSKYWPSDLSTKVTKKVTHITSEIIKISSFNLSSMMLIVVTVAVYIFPKSYESSIFIIHYACCLVFVQTIILSLTIDLGRRNKLKKILYFNFSAFVSQFIIYFSISFTKLEEVFIIQIITTLSFLLMFFRESFLRMKISIFASFIILFFSAILVDFYIANNSIFLQIFVFLLGVGLSVLTIYSWVNLDTERTS